jgi:hypothetical protein
MSIQLESIQVDRFEFTYPDLPTQPMKERKDQVSQTEQPDWDYYLMQRLQEDREVI